MVDNKNPTVKKSNTIIYLILLVLATLVVIGLYPKFKYTPIFNKIKERVFKTSTEMLDKASDQENQVVAETKYIPPHFEVEKKLVEPQEATSEVKNTALDQKDYGADLNTKIMFVISADKLADLLDTSYPFSGQVDVVMSEAEGVQLKNAMAKILPYAKTGVATGNEIRDEFTKSIYKEVYLTYLRSQTTFDATFLYYLNKLIFIKNNNNESLATTDIRYTLNEIEFYLGEDDLESALDIANNLSISNDALKVWLARLHKRIEVNKVIQLIEVEVNQYATKR